MLINSPNISGSLTVTGNSVISGSLNVLGSITGAITGSATTASYVEYTNVADKPALVSSSAQIEEFGIFATTGSNQFNGSQAITGSLTTTGTIVAQTLNVQQVTSSIIYSSGSNIFGNELSNTQQFTGSVSITGSLNTSIAAFGSAATVFLTSDGGTIRSRTAAQTLSDIAALPLAGGTLTGALNGTSASFTGDLTLQGSVTRNLKFLDSTNTNLNAQIQYDQISSNSGQLLFGTNNAGTFSTKLTIANTGAATFNLGSGEIKLNRAGTSEFLTLNTYYLLTNGNDQLLGSVTGATNIYAGSGASPKLTIASTGAATFSSRLEADGIIRSTSATAASSGSGAEIALSGGIAYLLGYNRTTSTYLPVGINGDSITFSTSNSAISRMVVHVTGGVSIIDGLAVGTGTQFASSIFFASAVLSAGAGTFPLKWNNSTGIVTYDTSSRLVKENIQDSPYGLHEVLQLQPRKYFRTDDQKEEIGFIADEVQSILPEFIPMVKKSLFTKNEEDIELIAGGVNYEKLTAVLVKAIQELKAENDTLKSRIDTLEQA